MADEEPKVSAQQQVAPKPYDGPIDSIADFCKLLKQELQIVGLNKLIRSGNVSDLAESKQLVGKYKMCLEAQDIIDTHLKMVLRAANAADEDDDPPPDRGIMGEDDEDDYEE